MDFHVNQAEIFSNDEEQDILIAKKARIIDHYTSFIIRSLELNQINVALEAAGKIVRVLFTSKLTPRNYYTVYVAVVQSISWISKSLSDTKIYSNKCISELYEIVQYCSSCMERLYLMITVAPELCKRNIISTLEIFDDLISMTCAAQDPIRALFLRYYFLSSFKDLLPDSNAKKAEESADLLLNNFAQLNRLWVRIEDIMSTDERRSQRSEFTEIIGENIKCIASLNNISINFYSNVIFPFFTKHIELCEDALAQYYILHYDILFFNDMYHAATIDQLFMCFSLVDQRVDILGIVNLLLNKLQKSEYIKDSNKSEAIFMTVAKNIEELFNSEGHLSIESKLDTLNKLISLALNINSNDVKNTRNLLRFAEFHIDLSIADQTLQTKESSNSLLNLLKVPLTVFTNSKFLFKLEYLPILIDRLNDEDRIVASELVCDYFINSKIMITNEKEVDFYIKCVDPIVRDPNLSNKFFSIRKNIEGGNDSETKKLLKIFNQKADEISDDDEETDL